MGQRSLARSLDVHFFHAPSWYGPQPLTPSTRQTRTILSPLSPAAHPTPPLTTPPAQHPPVAAADLADGRHGSAPSTWMATAAAILTVTLRRLPAFRAHAMRPEARAHACRSLLTRDIPGVLERARRVVSDRRRTCHLAPFGGADGGAHVRGTVQHQSRPYGPLVRRPCSSEVQPSRCLLQRVEERRRGGVERAEDDDWIVGIGLVPWIGRLRPAPARPGRRVPVHGSVLSFGRRGGRRRSLGRRTIPASPSSSRTARRGPSSPPPAARAR